MGLSTHKRQGGGEGQVLTENPTLHLLLLIRFPKLNFCISIAKDETQCEGKMMLHSDNKTASSRVQKEKARLPKLKSQLLSLCMFKKLFERALRHVYGRG